MSIRITTLSENTARMGDFLGEWGLSILVETGDARVLLDTGKGYSAMYNADTLGIDLRTVDKIVLSHGHHDHTGGLDNVLRRMNKQTEIVAHPDVWQQKYSRRKDEPDHYVGIPFQKTVLESRGARFNLTTRPVHVSETIMTTGEIPMLTDFEQVDSDLFVKDGSDFHADKVLDDQGLLVKTETGPVVIVGCAHRGIINTLYHVRELTGEERIRAVIGGSHLMHTSEERLWHTIEALRGLGIQKMGLCHCTDLPVAATLAREFDDVFFFNRAGTSIVLE